MKLVLDYLQEELSNYIIQQKDIKASISGCIYESEEIKRKINELTSQENNSFNVFSASGSLIEFNSREITTLKERLNLLKNDLEEYNDSMSFVNSKIANLEEVISHAKEYYHLFGNNDLVLTKTSNASFDNDIDEIEVDVNYTSFLNSIANRLFTLSKICKIDPGRVKLEMEHLYNNIIKYLSN